MQYLLIFPDETVKRVNRPLSANELEELGFEFVMIIDVNNAMQYDDVDDEWIPIPEYKGKAKKNRSK